jgi:hypothetical protein
MKYNLFIFSLPILLLLLPIGFQIMIGNKLIKKDRYLSFGFISFLSIVLEVVMTFVGLLVSLEGQMMKGHKNLSPGIISFGMLFLFVLILIVLIQILRYPRRKSKQYLNS